MSSSAAAGGAAESAQPPATEFARPAAGTLALGSVPTPAAPAPHFRVLPEGGVEVDEATGNGFHLGPILRKYTSARLVVKTGRRGTTSVELPLLYDALGLLRALRYDVEQFNSAAAGDLPPSALKYACYRSLGRRPLSASACRGRARAPSSSPGWTN